MGGPRGRRIRLVSTKDCLNGDHETAEKVSWRLSELFMNEKDLGDNCIGQMQSLKEDCCMLTLFQFEASIRPAGFVRRTML